MQARKYRAIRNNTRGMIHSFTLSPTKQADESFALFFSQPLWCCYIALLSASGNVTTVYGYVAKVDLNSSWVGVLFQPDKRSHLVTSKNVLA
jgi:hypothetical protein